MLKNAGKMEWFESMCAHFPLLLNLLHGSARLCNGRKIQGFSAFSVFLVFPNHTDHFRSLLQGIPQGNSFLLIFPCTEFDGTTCDGLLAA